MKHLDLNAMGVVEMEAVEMKETDGGEAWWVFIADAVSDYIDGFAKGYQDGKKQLNQ